MRCSLPAHGAGFQCKWHRIPSHSLARADLSFVFGQPLDPEYNFARAEQNIRDAALKGCHLVVLPEFYLTSWVPESPEFATYCEKSFPYLKRYQELAQQLHIHIVPGTIVEPVAADKPDATEPVTELRNMSYFIAASTGEILSTYQKKNLWHPERGVLTPGTSTPHRSFDVPLPGGNGGTVRVGLLICWDLVFPEPFRELVADGAELIVVPAFWYINKIDPEVLELNPRSEEMLIDSTTVARAYENTCAVAFCNGWGGSQIAMPILGSLGKLGNEQEGMVVGEVDFETVRYSERYYKIRKDLNGDEWHYSNVRSRLAK